MPPTKQPKEPVGVRAARWLIAAQLRYGRTRQSSVAGGGPLTLPTVRDAAAKFKTGKSQVGRNVKALRETGRPALSGRPSGRPVASLLVTIFAPSLRRDTAVTTDTADTADTAGLEPDSDAEHGPAASPSGQLRSSPAAPPNPYPRPTTARKAPAPSRPPAMVYRWDDYRETLYRLYIQERKSLDDIVDYMREQHGFQPSRRSYQVAFKRWDFPQKLNPAYKNEKLVARVGELWGQNVAQKDMLPILASEGYVDVGPREITNIRTRNGWLLRSPYNAFGMMDPNKPKPPWASEPISLDTDAEGDDDDDEDEDADGDDNGDNAASHAAVSTSQVNPYGYGPGQTSAADAQIQEETLDAMREARREYLKRALAAESQERWVTKKRRRHTKAYGGLPADPPGPPRFPSETTLTESKEILQLDAATYKTVRQKFYDICVNAGVYKKTLAGAERWEQLKDQLIRETMHLRAVFWDPAGMDQKKLAVEIIACDVAKKIRVDNTGLKMDEAKLVLGLNPEQGRKIRAQLYNILAQEKFTSKLEEGLEYFETLKQRWIAGSEELASVIAAGPADPDYERKMKAIKVLCRDVTRRYREDMAKAGKFPAVLVPIPQKPKPAPKKKKPRPRQPTPSPPPFATEPPAPEAFEGTLQFSVWEPPTGPRPRGRPKKGSRGKQPEALPHTASRLVLVEPDAESTESPAEQQMVDAQLEADVPVMVDDDDDDEPSVHPPHQRQHQQHQQQQQQHHQQGEAPPPSSSGAVAVFFRLNPSSTAFFRAAPRQWICALPGRTIDALRRGAVQKTPGALCYKIEGIVKDDDSGVELPLPVSDQVELDTYLAHVEAQGRGAPTFTVHVVPGE